jgi:predicted esterase
VIHVPVTVHGRVLIEHDGDAAVSSGVLVGFHGYAQTAGDMMAELRQIPGADAWTRLSIQALNRFYTRGDSRVVANWMTREDRELAIADNIAYVDAALSQALDAGAPEHKGTRALVFVGFSQGVAMAYRAALMGQRSATGVIALAGDLPPELKTEDPLRQPWPRVLIGVGEQEEWYSPEKVASDEAFLSSRRIDHAVVRFAGGHEWTDEFRAAAGRFLATATS